MWRVLNVSNIRIFYFTILCRLKFNKKFLFLGNQSQIIFNYEHQLKRSGYNLIVGGFGGVEGRDFMCVQGLDGTLMFFEQETLALFRTLTNFLLPFPIIYVPHTDSFVMLNANWDLESYRWVHLYLALNSDLVV